MATEKSNKFIKTVDECLTDGAKNGIFHVSLEDDVLDGRIVTIEGKQVVNFGSCSYLGLEVDHRLKQGAIDATMRYGTQYSSSRSYSFCNLYDEIEDLFCKIFDNNHAILAATTTLTHLGALPILVQENDLVILDQQVHASVHLAVQLVKVKGTQVEIIRHSQLNMLEDLIKKNPNKYNKIWYMIDGLYSMYGDYAPIKELAYLMEKYPNFHLYVDDSHGMSWVGKNGSGYVLSQMPMHPKLVLTTSIAKGLGTGGGVLVMQDKEMIRKILTCGSSYTFSGPLQPPMLGASIASAKIHLTDEINILQNKLKEKLNLTQSLLTQYNLPVLRPSDSPIFYIGLGLPRIGYNMVKRLMNEGFYTNIGIFPAVPVECTGLRLVITNNQTNEDIKNVLDAIKYHFPKVLEEEGSTVDDISNHFHTPFEETKKTYSLSSLGNKASTFEIQHELTINKIDKALWNNLLGDNGSFDWEGCRFIEETFCDNPEPENNWKVHYLIIKDANKKPVLATFFTELLCKDDMVAPADVSEQLEKIRKNDHYYLSSKVVMMGSLLSEGNHLYLDKTSADWKAAMIEMINIMNDVRRKCDAKMIQLRDLDSDDTELRDFLIKEGFIKIDMPDTHIIENLNWKSEEDFINTLSPRSRQHVRKYALNTKDYFKFNVLKKDFIPDSDKIAKWYELYMNIKEHSYNLNTFNLPLKLFKNINGYKGWDVMEITFNDDLDLKFGTNKEPLAVMFCYKSEEGNYCPLLLGLNYNYNKDYNIYRQVLYQAVKRGWELNTKKTYIGMEASIEKHKFGAKNFGKSVYIQSEDNFNMEKLALIMQNKR